MESSHNLSDKNLTMESDFIKLELEDIKEENRTSEDVRKLIFCEF